MKKPALWFAGVLVPTVVALLAGGGYAFITERVSERKPIEVTVVSTPTPMGSAPAKHRSSQLPPVARAAVVHEFELVVPDPKKLPKGFDKITDCVRLAQVAKAAGGVAPPEKEDTWKGRVMVRGAAKKGVQIVDLRAKITKHRPVLDGFHLSCREEEVNSDPPARRSPIDRVNLFFDLAGADLDLTDTVPVSKQGKLEPGESQRKIDFKDFTTDPPITLAENEPVELTVHTSTSTDDLEWHVEADILVGGEVRRQVINDNGKEFRTYGYRRLNDYRAGHRVYVSDDGSTRAIDWGVDHQVKVKQDRSMGRVLIWNGIKFPYVPGLTVHRTIRESGTGEIRLGRKVLIEIDVDQDAVEAPEPSRRFDPELFEGRFCESDAGNGTVVDVQPEVTRTTRVAGRDQVRRSVGYRCLAGDTAQGPYRQEFLHREGSKYSFETSVDGGASDAERRLAASILRRIRDESR